MYCLLAGIAVITEFWQMPVDLIPTPQTIDRFVWDELVPCIAAFPRDRHPK